MAFWISLAFRADLLADLEDFFVVLDAAADLDAFLLTTVMPLNSFSTSTVATALLEPQRSLNLARRSFSAASCSSNVSSRTAGAAGSEGVSSLTSSVGVSAVG